jgi:hypothetical protein
MRQETQQQASIEAAQQEIFDRVKKLAEDEIGLNGGLCLCGQDCLDICEVFRINVPKEVEKSFRQQDFSHQFNAEGIASLKDPIELKREMQQTVDCLFQSEMADSSEG